MYLASAIAIFVCSLAIIGLAMFSADKGQAAWGIVGIFIALQVWFLDRGRRKHLEQYAQAEAQRATRRTTYVPIVPAGYNFDDLLTAAGRNLSLSKFVVSHNVALPNGDTVDLVASGIESSLLGAGGPSVVQRLFLQHPRIATAAALTSCLREAFSMSSVHAITLSCGASVSRTSYCHASPSTPQPPSSSLLRRGGHPSAG